MSFKTSRIGMPMIAALAMMAAPALAQDAPPSDCLSSSLSNELAVKLTDDGLSRAGVGAQATDADRMEMMAAMTVCLGAHNVAEDKQEAFFKANLTHMIGGELRRRMVEAGMDMEPVERLALAFADNPNLSVDNYIAQRPEEFEQSIDAVAKQNNMSTYEIGTWIGFYVAMRGQQIINERVLADS